MCNVDVVLLVMYCMYISAVIATTADISYLCYLLYCLRLFVVVYKLGNAWVTLYLPNIS